MVDMTNATMTGQFVGAGSLAPLTSRKVARAVSLPAMTNTSDETKDEQLMLDYAQGNSRAFERLYGRHKGGLFRYFRRQCASAAIAEELFQDTWLKVVGARHRYKPTAKFTTWLYTLAHNRLIDHYRVSSRGVPMSYSDDDPLDTVPGPQSQNPIHKADVQQQTDRLLAAIDELPEAQREAFLMREEVGMSVEEIANATKVNRETAKSRLRYAVAKLRRSMESTS